MMMPVFDSNGQLDRATAKAAINPFSIFHSMGSAMLSWSDGTFSGGKGLLCVAPCN
jgi:hypothetical protein